MQLIRIFFTKQDEASYISHLDLQRVMARALRRSGLPVWYSQGFNPHIYMTFALPLPLMHHSLCEAVDCKTEDKRQDFSEYLAPLNASLPRGIAATAIRAPKMTANDIARAEYRITYPVSAEALAKGLALYSSLLAAPVMRKTKRSETEVDLKEYVPSLHPLANTSSFEVCLPAGGTLNYNPELLVGFLAESCGLTGTPHILRQRILNARGEPFA